ncbi:tryptophanase leader peptide [Cronobacter dublinensis]|nr:tryptophanase leader peptide [Cronobacter dublinensis]
MNVLSLSYGLIQRGGLNAWYNLDHRISEDFPR